MPFFFIRKNLIFFSLAVTWPFCLTVDLFSFMHYSLCLHFLKSNNSKVTSNLYIAKYNGYYLILIVKSCFNLLSNFSYFWQKNLHYYKEFLHWDLARVDIIIKIVIMSGPTKSDYIIHVAEWLSKESAHYSSKANHRNYYCPAHLWDYFPYISSGKFWQWYPKC